MGSCSTGHTKNLKVENKFPNIEVDSSSIARFSKSLTYKTFWNQDGHFQKEEFSNFIQFLKYSFPLVHKTLEVERINELSLLFKWQGINKKSPSNMIIAHYDVVPVEDEKKWTFKPFSGTVSDGMVWGRGAIDDKFSVMATLEAVEKLIKEGYRPRGDLYLGFGHDEEIMGVQGGMEIAKSLKKKGVRLASLLDEGPSVIKGLLPRKENLNVAYIGIATKGNAYIKLSATGPGGHASLAPKRNPILTLSNAITKLNNMKLREEITPPLKKMLISMKDEYDAPTNWILSNPDLFSYFIIQDFKKKRISRTLVRDDISFNIITAGDKDATVPSSAELILSSSILPGGNYDNRLKEIQNTLHGMDIVVQPVRFKHNHVPHMYNPTDSSSTESKIYKDIELSIKQSYGKVTTLPTLMPGGSDGKHYKNLGVVENVYYFNPIYLTQEELNTFHAKDERLPVSSYYRAILFYHSYIKKL